MKIKMLRSQKTIIGLLRADVFYDLNDDDQDQKAVCDRVIDRKFAVEVDDKAIKKAKATAEKIGAASDLGKAEAAQSAAVMAAALAEISQKGIAADKALEGLLKKFEKETDAAKKSVIGADIEAKRAEIDVLTKDFEAAGGGIGVDQ